MSPPSISVYESKRTLRTQLTNTDQHLRTKVSSSSNGQSGCKDKVLGPNHHLTNLTWSGRNYYIVSASSSFSYLRTSIDLFKAINVRVTSDELDILHENKTNRVHVTGNDRTDYLGVVGVYHQLHCLNNIRQLLSWDYYGPKVGDRKHGEGFAEEHTSKFTSFQMCRTPTKSIQLTVLMPSAKLWCATLTRLCIHRNGNGSLELVDLASMWRQHICPHVCNGTAWTLGRARESWYLASTSFFPIMQLSELSVWVEMMVDEFHSFVMNMKFQSCSTLHVPQSSRRCKCAGKSLFFFK